MSQLCIFFVEANESLVNCCPPFLSPVYIAHAQRNIFSLGVMPEVRASLSAVYNTIQYKALYYRINIVYIGMI